MFSNLRATYRVKCTSSNQNLTCFVRYFKILNTVLKGILKQIVCGTQDVKLYHFQNSVDSFEIARNRMISCIGFWAADVLDTKYLGIPSFTFTMSSDHYGSMVYFIQSSQNLTITNAI